MSRGVWRSGSAFALHAKGQGFKPLNVHLCDSLFFLADYSTSSAYHAINCKADHERGKSKIKEICIMVFWVTYLLMGQPPIDWKVMFSLG